MATKTTDFWDNVNKTKSCWKWTGPRFGPKGYGVWVEDGTRRLAHRVAYERSTGAVLRGVFLRSTCKDKGCVNPDHMVESNP